MWSLSWCTLPRFNLFLIRNRLVVKNNSSTCITNSHFSFYFFLYHFSLLLKLQEIRCINLLFDHLQIFLRVFWFWQWNFINRFLIILKKILVLILNLICALFSRCLLILKILEVLLVLCILLIIRIL